MSLMKKIKEIKDKLDLSKRYPNYFNKKIFRIGVAFLFLYIFILLINFGFGASWNYINCDNPSGCINPYIECDNSVWVVDPTCEYYKFNPCKGLNCDTYMIEYGDYIGEKPPFIVKFGDDIIFSIIMLTILFNHINYMRWRK